MNHTPEPWIPLAEHPDFDCVNISLVDFKRACLCVNAFAGVEDPVAYIADLREGHTTAYLLGKEEAKTEIAAFKMGNEYMKEAHLLDVEVQDKLKADKQVLMDALEDLEYCALVKFVNCAETKEEKELDVLCGKAREALKKVGE